ncbi:hypothetical protein BDW71DRAFT_200617 [Aspergillus fruticulosus]
MSTSSLGLLNLPSLLPIVTETVPPTISSKALPIPSILTGVDNLLSEIDMNTVSPLDWVMAPEPDRPLITSWNALPEMGTHPLSFAPTTTATSLAGNLPTPETNIIVSIPTGWSSGSQISLNQEVPLQAQGSDQTLSTSYTEINIIVSISTDTHRLSHEQPAMAAPTSAVDKSSRSWKKVSVTRAPAKPLITPPFPSYNQMVYNGGSLSTITEGETVPVSSPTPPVPNQDSE